MSASKWKIELARELRRRATPAERYAWRILRNRGVLGLKVRRQHVIRGFIVDFYCADLRCVLELHGSVHDSPAQRAYDRERDAVLSGLGLLVVRIPNAKVSKAALERILVRVSDLRGSCPSPGTGEGTGEGEPC